MDPSPFTTVHRGRVISATERQRVQGRAVMLGGWGGGNVETVTSNDFWLRTALGDIHFAMGERQVPPMLVNHAVTVVMAGSEVVAVANHSTGTQCLYRPKGIYRSGNWGCLLIFVACLAGVLCLIAEFALQLNIPFGAVVIVVGILWLVLVRHFNTSHTRHNAALDQKLQELINFDRAEVAAKAWDIQPPPLNP